MRRVATIGWIAAVLWNAGCGGDSAYRVEWGFKNDPNLSPPELDAELSTLSGRWTAWETLHLALARDLSHLPSGGPVPSGQVSSCDAALRGLVESCPPGEDIDVAAQCLIDLYANLRSQAIVHSPSMVSRQLDRAEWDLRSAVRRRGLDI